MPERYTPTAEEINMAESTMSDSQKNSSEIRAKNYEQEQPPWESFDEKVDENFIRKAPSPEAVKKMDESVEELGQALAGAGSSWHLDGALNISLMNGANENSEKYIGEHKDVDISVEEKDLEAVEAQLLKNGYGLFLSRTDKGGTKKMMRRVDYKKFVESGTEHLLIAAIDENGKLRQDKALNFVDVHVVKRNENGQPVGVSEVPIPEKWMQPQLLEFHGRQINISHPGKVLYYKLHQDRGYDKTDAQRLIETGKITEEDIDDIRGVLEEEFKISIERGRKVFEKIAKQIRPGMGADQILVAIQSNLEFGRQGLEDLAQQIADAEDKSADGILDIAIKLFGVEERNNQKRQELVKMRQRVKEIREI